ncbi:MAG: lytic transglycosylase domain-containing protein [Deltaproteobacteria bacterium]|nr:lytic transglycosylase domain-containing protein [Deltaproteobacteria bacterium]
MPVSTPVIASPLAPVCSYRDQSGVIHITNSPCQDAVQDIQVAGWSSSPEEAPTALVGVKKAGSCLARKAEARDLVLSAVSPAAYPPVSLQPGASSTLVPSRAGATVRRFRDSKGVLHIVGRGPAEPIRLGPAPSLPATAALAGFAVRPRVYPQRSFPLPKKLVRHASTVLVRKDSRGRIIICSVRRPGPSDTRKGSCRLEPVLWEAASRYGLPVSLIEAVIRAESGFNPKAVSPKGAMGLMQLMPGTAEFLGVKDPFCPRENILAGCRYLRLLLDFFGQSLPLALAAYNAGFQRVLDAGCRVPDIKETKDFVTKVLGYYFLRQKQLYYRPWHLARYPLWGRNPASL